MTDDKATLPDAAHHTNGPFGQSVVPWFSAEQMYAFRAEGVAAAVAAEQAEASRLRLALLAISTAAQTNPAARRLACDVLAANAIRATAPKG